jgi:hypothetical protein
MAWWSSDTGGWRGWVEFVVEEEGLDETDLQALMYFSSPLMLLFLRKSVFAST